MERIKPEFTENALAILERRYLKRDEDGNVIETPEDMLRRVSELVASAEKLYGASDREVSEWELRFYNLMASLDFLPNSPTLMNAKRKLGQLAACFVLPVGDSMEEIFDAVKWTAMVHKSGGGTGFNFSRLRPKGDVVSSTNGVASGPVSFMEVFDITTEVVQQGGMRRGANMGILNVNHPDIEEFIMAKSEENKRLKNFNISVGAFDDFMQKVLDDGEYEILNPRTGEVVRKCKAKELFDKIVNQAWKTGDPGMVFLDTINRANTLPGLGPIESTNPCGEQVLHPFGSCNLGSINLLHMVANGKVDWDKLAGTVTLSIRFLDNVIDVNKFPLKQIEEMTKGTRNVGLGVMGWAEMLYELGVPYDSSEALELAEKVMKFINDTAREASRELGEQRGAFPYIDRSIWKGTTMRNAGVTTIAPTGTISLIAGTSSGIEPVFALAYRRKALKGEKNEITLVDFNKQLERIAKESGFWSEDFKSAVLERGSIQEINGVPEDVKRVFVVSHDIAPEWHVKMQAAFQKYVENAVSKTINMPHTASVSDVADAYILAWKLGCKGITIYRDRSKQEQVLYVGVKGGEEEKHTNGLPRPKRRPFILSGRTQKLKTAFGNLYLTLNELDGKPFEVFATLGKSGKDTMADTEAIGRLISLALRSGIPMEEVINQLKGIGGSQPTYSHGEIVLSIPDAIAKGLERLLKAKVEQVEVELCPKCGAVLQHMEGCVTCPVCGYSKCD